MKCFKIGLVLATVFSLLVLPSKSYSQTHPVLAPCGDQTARTDERTCMACNLYWEAGAEPTKGKFAVAFVVMNRMRAAGYPNSACGVVWHKERGGVEQFSWTARPQPVVDYGRGERTNWETSWKIAEFMLALRHDPDYDEFDLTHGALYYHSLAQNPWPAKHEVGQIGHHRFYVDRRGLRPTPKPYCDLAGMANLDVCPNWFPPKPVAVAIPHDPNAVCRASFWWDPERLFQRNVGLEQPYQVHHSSMLGPFQIVLGWLGR